MRRVFVIALPPRSPSTHAKHKETPTRVFVIALSHNHPSTHTEHEETPMLVSFCVWHCFLALQHMPSTKPHPHWCVFVVGVFSSPNQTCRAASTKWHPHWCHFVVAVISASHHQCWPWNHTLVGVFLWLVSFLCPSTLAKHKMAPSLAPFRGWHLSYISPHTLSMKLHLRLCYFVLGSFPTPRMNINGCLLNILYSIKHLLYIF